MVACDVALNLWRTRVCGERPVTRRVIGHATFPWRRERWAPYVVPITMRTPALAAAVAAVALGACGSPKPHAATAPTANRCDVPSPQPSASGHVTAGVATAAAARAMHFDGVISVNQAHLGDSEPRGSCDASDQ